MYERADTQGSSRRWWEKPAHSVAVLALVLVGLSLLTDAGGFLSTDVGGKVATLEAMDRRGDLSPDLGYWAEAVDPDGSLYPMWSTSHVDDKWINATTLPMLYAALPLYRAGGVHLAVLVPILGTLLAALGAWRLARHLGSDGIFAFWIIGLASPATIYALDLWEHSLALALMVWAVILALESSRDDRATGAALGSGLLFGAAAAMRQEALVYGFVTGSALGVRLLVSRRPLTAVIRGGAMAIGAATMLILNALLEWVAIGSSTRAGRSSGTAVAAGGELTLRIKEAIITGASPFDRSELVFIALSIVMAGLLIELGRRARPEQAEPIGLIVAALGAIVLIAVVNLALGGLSFVPGLAATTPVALLALSHIGADPDHRFVAAIAVLSLPLVWMLQFTGGAVPQWGGRYILLSGTLLVAIATAAMTSERAIRVLRGAALAGFAVTLLGVVWTMERTHSFAEAMTTLADRDEPVLVFHDPHIAREGGVFVLDEQWLAATGAEARAEAAEALEALGIDEVGFVEHDRGEAPLTLPGWTIIDESRLELVSGSYLRITTLEAPN